MDYKVICVKGGEIKPFTGENLVNIREIGENIGFIAYDISSEKGYAGHIDCPWQISEGQEDIDRRLTTLTDLEKTLFKIYDDGGKAKQVKFWGYGNRHNRISDAGFSVEEMTQALAEREHRANFIRSYLLSYGIRPENLFLDLKPEEVDFADLGEIFFNPKKQRFRTKLYLSEWGKFPNPFSDKSNEDESGIDKSGQDPRFTV